ncbi:MAG: (d)CMP kinase, partial [Firmicutes bacterium]|nr:(d)CMP kinase [Bacillota bacterium]
MDTSNNVRASKNDAGPVVAIDGPAGAGKSTVAKAVAKIFGMAYVSTGLIYRALTLKALRMGIDVRETESLVRLAETTEVAVEPNEGECRVFLDGEDVTGELTSPEIGAYVSQVAEIPGVRSALLDIQRAIGSKGSVVMDGRDIGTVVMPCADVKIFLVADFDERVRRRVAQARERGYDVVE